MNPHCFSTERVFAFFSLLKPRNALSAGLYPRIFGRTLTTYIPVAVLHEEHPTLPVSLVLLPLPAPCRRYFSLSLFFVYVYMCDTRVRTRVFHVSPRFRTCIYVCIRRDENPSPSLFYFLVLPLSTFVRSFSDPLSLSLPLYITPIHATTIFHQFFSLSYYGSRLKG